ncbi:MAG: DUF2267 domain-containing protein [Chloroflexaceae bacterium]|nr:DUF2267 domain-containing protein [Chloroflexaceae bacterium]
MAAAEHQTMVEMVAEKAGISREQAQTALDTVLGFLKDKLPTPIASQIDGLMQQDVSGLSGQVDSAMGMLGGILGKKE